MTEPTKHEPGASLNELRSTLEDHGLELSDDGHIRWQKTNPEHPRNWAMWRKIHDTSVILFLELVTTMNGTAGTSAANQAQLDYGISQTVAVFAFTSTYIIGQGVGGIFFPPFSEAFGRKSLYVISTLLYCIFCIIAAAVPSFAAVVVARFITGVLSAIPTIVVAGSIEDIFNMQDRVWMIFCWALVGNLGLALGPIFSTYVTIALQWQWVFYIAAIVTGVIFILCLGLKESRPSLLLERKVSVLRKSSTLGSYSTRNPDHVPDVKSFFDVTVFRPLRLLFTEPIIVMVTIMDSVATALFYVQAESLLLVYTSLGFSTSQASLSQVPIAIGCLLGLFPRLYDSHILRVRRQRGQVLAPEDKLFGFSLGAPTLALALWWFAWTIPPLVHAPWIASMLALVPAGFALNDITFTLQGYLADSYTVYAASAFAGGLLARSLLIAAVLPFVHHMYTDISANAATSIVAGMATLFCISPWVLLKHGKAIRKASPFAQYSLNVYVENQVEDDMNTAGVVLGS